ncbi:hypothetical protein KQI77_03055 [Clostridium sp. MSJ-8]|uniref:DUF5685 family protein n=1 Tax=Clostridium sp. MSJ-8 TaxID=2841510 RepID=UPI001C0EDA65|nr:DUF5685 family protein [Clostridium sp. MSJ-8]MBU5487142.1 hypothetical protein [Clostridium sp. MSJ-8]
MFGYIIPVEENLCTEDQELLKKYYCGLCHKIKSKYGNIPRTTLSYDSTFFAILLDGISLYDPVTIKTSCFKHPLSTNSYFSCSKALDYCADLNIALVYYKILDDINDDRTIKSVTLKNLVKPYFKMLNNISLKHSFSHNLNSLNQLELNNNSSSLDVICDPFSKLLGEILRDCPFELINDTNKTRTLLYEFGYSLGKWIYIMDAIEDLQVDMIKKKFNPLNCIFNKNNLPYKDLLPIIKGKIDFYLITLVSNCLDLLNKLPIKRNKSILTNFINLGLTQKYMNIFSNL